MFRVRFPDGLTFRARIGSLEGPPVDPEVGRTDIGWFLGGAAVDQGTLEWPPLVVFHVDEADDGQGVRSGPNGGHSG